MTFGRALIVLRLYGLLIAMVISVMSCLFPVASPKAATITLTASQDTTLYTLYEERSQAFRITLRLENGVEISDAVLWEIQDNTES